MLFFLIRRTLAALPSFLGVVTFVFLLTHLIPGDPVENMLGERASHEDKEVLRKKLRLDRPLYEQYLSMITDFSTGNLGTSLVSRKPVSSSLKAHLPPTLELALGAFFLSLLLGLPIGVLSAIHPRSFIDRFCLFFSTLGISVPCFVSAPILIWCLALVLPIFPVGERGGMAHLFLPSLSLAIPLGSYIMRMTKTSMVQVIKSDFIRTAKAKSLPESTIYFKHALSNAASPIITIVGLQLGALLTGLVITETIFDWPGLGSLLFTALKQRDYPTIQGCVVIIACIYLIVNTMTDLLYGWINPKVRVF